MDAREVALLTLDTCQHQGGWSDQILKKQLAAAGLDRRDGALATQLCFGVLQNLLLLDFYLSKFSNLPLKKLESKVLQALRLGAYQMLFLDKIPHSAAVNRAVELTRTHCKNPRAPGMVNAVLRNLERTLDRLPTIPQDDPVQYLSILYSHPAWLVEELLLRLGLDGTARLLEADNSRPPVTAMVNTLKTTRRPWPEPWPPRGRRRSPTLAGGLSAPVPHRGSGGSARLSGGPVLCPGPGLPAGGAGRRAGAGNAGAGRVRRPRGQDLCRRPGHGGPGGDILLRPAPPQEEADPGGGGPTGPVLCPPHDRRRPAVPTGVGGGLRSGFGGRPCSGLGVIRKKPDIRYKDPAPLAGLPQVQRAILDNACRYVRPGGALLYSTCTVLRRENEEVAAAFLEGHPDYKAEPFTLPGPVGTAGEGMITLWPQVHGTDGFFICKLRKDGAP